MKKLDRLQLDKRGLRWQVTGQKINVSTINQKVLVSFITILDFRSWKIAKSLYAFGKIDSFISYIGSCESNIMCDFQ